MFKAELIKAVKGGEPLIQGCDLSNGDYQSADLGGGIFDSVVFTNADLRGAKLKECVFF